MSLVFCQPRQHQQGAIQELRQAGTVLGQAQLKLELKLTSFMICCIELIILVKLC